MPRRSLVGRRRYEVSAVGPIAFAKRYRPAARTCAIIVDASFNQLAPLAAQTQPAGWRGDGLRRTAVARARSARAAGVSCELGPSVGDAGLRPAAGLREAARSFRQASRRGGRHG